MSIWNKILLGFIFIAALAFFYLSARTLKTHQVWRESAQGFEKALNKVEQAKKALAEGVQEGEEFRKGIRQVRLDLHKLLLNRGRIWREVVPGQVDAATGEVMVAVNSPDPHQIIDKMVVYVFEETPAIDGGKYLGEFKVDGVDPKQVKLKPLFKLDRQIAGKKIDQDRIDRVAGSRGTWILYERLPSDIPWLFAELSEEELRAMVPEALLAEFLKDGKPAEADDPEERIDAKTKNYIRKLHDYATLLRQIDMTRSALVDLTESEIRDKKAVEDALADAGKQNVFHKKSIAEAETEKALVTKEEGAVAAHLADVDAALADVTGKIASAVAAIQSMVGEIAKIQLDASQRINSRTRALMQAGNVQ